MLDDGHAKSAANNPSSPLLFRPQTPHPRQLGTAVAAVVDSRGTSALLRRLGWWQPGSQLCRRTFGARGPKQIAESGLRFARLPLPGSWPGGGRTEQYAFTTA